METERKFLILRECANDLYRFDAEPFEIEQYYVSVGKTEERFRRCGEAYFHTIKKVTENPLTREETETPCLREDFEKNLPRRNGDVILKERHVFSLNNLKIEIDFYKGRLKGLVVGEVEFAGDKEAGGFLPPFFFGKEITTDKRYLNQNLALNGLPEDDF